MNKTQLRQAALEKIMEAMANINPPVDISIEQAEQMALVFRLDADNIPSDDAIKPELVAHIVANTKLPYIRPVAVQDDSIDRNQLQHALELVDPDDPEA